MRTLLLSEIFPPRTGGSGRWFEGIYGRLPKDRVVLAVGAAPGQVEYDSTHDLTIRRLALHSDRWDLRSLHALGYYGRTARRVRQIAEQEEVGRIDCARCLPEGWIGWLMQRWVRLPYDCYVHGEDAETAATSRELSFMVRRVFGGARRLVCNSANTARLVRETWGVPVAKLRVLHPGVDAGRFVPAPRDRATRWKLGWGEGPVLLTVGRLQRRKGHDVLIRALPAIRDAFPDVLYAIVGAGEEAESLRRLVRELGLSGHVQFLGEPDDGTLLSCYQQCDVFVLPNRAVGRDIEGFGIVLLEAQSCGRPVVAGASGGTAETMRVGETGVVIGCDGPSPLDRVIVELLSDPARRERMGRGGREWVLERFDWPRVMPQVRELFEEGEVEEGPGRTAGAMALAHGAELGSPGNVVGSAAESSGTACVGSVRGSGLDVGRR
jgi:phosphatidylinositol alpha-1,6-mannosyltransferase